MGISEPMIETLVHAFYARVRQDAVLGPIFDGAIGDGWDAHLAKLCDFWSSVLLGTAREIWEPPAAQLVSARARMIGRSLRLGLAASRGELRLDV
jgi:hemoglobin